MAEPGFDPKRVVVEAIDDVNWKVVEPFTYRGNRDPFTVEAGMRTDFASVPRVFVWFLPRYGRYTLAAILHDHLWRNLAAHKKMSYRDADGIFRQAMRVLGVSFLRRWIMWAAVRWGALAKPNGRAGWLREAPRVLLVTLIALPFLIPPAAFVIGALALFELVELILWAPLKLIERRKVRRGVEAPKQANAPTMQWSL